MWCTRLLFRFHYAQSRTMTLTFNIRPIRPSSTYDPDYVIHSTYDPVGLVVMWAILHYKFLVNRDVVVQFPMSYTSTLKQQFHAIANYDSLNEYNVASWSQTNRIPVTSRRWIPMAIKRKRPECRTSTEAEDQVEDEEDTSKKRKT